MTVTGADIPPEVLVMVVKTLVKPDTLREDKQRLSACSQVCKYWCTVCRPAVFERLWLRVAADVHTLRSIVLAPPIGGTPSTASLVRHLDVWPEAKEGAGSQGPPWLHHVYLLLHRLPNCTGDISLEAGPGPGASFLRGHDLPRKLPAAYFPFTDVWIRDIRFKRFSELRRICRAMRALQKMRGTNVTWEVDDSSPIGQYGDIWTGGLPAVCLKEKYGDASRFGFRVDVGPLKDYPRYRGLVATAAVICETVHALVNENAQCFDVICTRDNKGNMVLRIGLSYKFSDPIVTFFPVSTGPDTSGATYQDNPHNISTSVAPPCTVTLTVKLGPRAHLEHDWATLRHECLRLGPALTSVVFQFHSRDAIGEFHAHNVHIVSEWAGELAVVYQQVEGNDDIERDARVVEEWTFELYEDGFRGCVQKR